MSFSYLDYYEYGLKQRMSTGSVDVSKVYDGGRYIVGPYFTFVKYQADAHLVVIDELSVFSKGVTEDSIGLSFSIDVDFTFLLIEDEIGDVHQELAGSYKGVIENRAKAAMKNDAAAKFNFTDFFQSRKVIEQSFRNAIQEKWDEEPRLHCNIDQFHLSRIRIPESVAVKQLEARVQNERNDREQFLQEAQIEREETNVLVNGIRLRKEKTLREARANASLTLARAEADAQRIKAMAVVNGTRELFKKVGIVTQDHMTAFTYIKSLRERNQLNLAVSYLSEETVVRTTPATTAIGG